MPGAAYSLGYSPETGVQFSYGIVPEPPKPVAGEPMFPTRTLLIIGGLAAAALLLFVLTK